MFKLKSKNILKEMGFKQSGCDWVCKGKTDKGTICTLFTVYAGSSYIRYARTGYICDSQLKLIYEWTKKDYIEWEDMIK